MHRARERLVKLARKASVDLAPSPTRGWKHALIAASALRPRQAVQARQSVAEDDRTYLGASRATSCARSRATPRWRASSPIRSCSPAGCASSASISAKKVYSRLHAPEVECIGKGKAHRPYEFGVKVSLPRRSIARRADSSSPTPRRCRATHDGHTLAPRP